MSTLRGGARCVPWHRCPEACTAAAPVVSLLHPPRCAAGFADGRMRCLQAGSGAVLWAAQALPSAVAHVVAAPDGRRLLCCGR